MVADDQGRQRQGGLTGRNRTTAFSGISLTGRAKSAPMDRRVRQVVGRGRAICFVLGCAAEVSSRAIGSD